MQAAVEKRCSRCKHTRSIDQFHRQLGGVRGQCKTCVRELRKAHYKRHVAEGREHEARERNAESNRAGRVAAYGITLAQYDLMLQAQAGVCAICKRPETAKSKHGKPFAMSIDHDHATGAVRALLCLSCNRAVGYLHESPERAEALAAYLRQHGK